MSKATRNADRQAVLDAERAINEQYLREIERLLEEQPHLIKQISVVQSQHWTTSSLPRPGIDAGAVSAVIGRVALEEGHPYADSLGDSFYIAGWRIEKGDFETVNWAAPIASLFFEGRASKYELAPSLIGRRTFVLRLDDLVDYDDESELEGTAPFERKRRALEVPTAPRRRRPADEPRPDVGPSTGGTSDEHRTEPTTGDVETEPRDEATDHDNQPEPQRDKQPDLLAEAAQPDSATEGTEELREVHAVLDRVQDLRAASAVLKVMEMPKTGRMGVVLPTMQPDQYRYVSWPGDRGLIVQGQPGTGKTVIAAHRAVYLTSTEREAKRVARIAIIGPSDNYVEHVAPIVSELKEPQAEVRVLSLPAFLQSIIGLRSRPKPGTIGRIESSWELGRAVEDFVRSLPARPAGGSIDRRVRQVVEALSTVDRSVVADDELRSWLRSLPAWTELSSQARYLPMLATVALALSPRAAGDWVGHLIVDEAQDVRPLEWRILTHSLLEPGGHLSLFGDMNQRRSDWSAPTWHQVAIDLELTDDDGRSSVEELENGYRSTKQILRFANKLLPKGERAERALSQGPEPQVHKVQAGDRTRAAVDEATALASRHDGMIAVISVEPTPISTEFRKRSWVRGRFQHSWTLDGRTAIVLHPDEARGLEFDGAVVVEPGDFPENVGRQGVLYTSLTRANKELSVIHSAVLPKELRPQRVH
jgi:hypothetical protein